jgi:TfoX/Sxy family transcriptional regulator of competence genes
MLKDRMHGSYHLFFNTELIALLQRQRIAAAPNQSANLETVIQ